MTTSNDQAGKYASVNGIELYYEVHGTGKPLIMLHGGFGTFDMCSAIWPALATSHQVIGVDLYGHGRTAMVDRPLAFESMAADIAGLIEYLGLAQVDLLGYSLGAAVALQTAIHYPARVNKLVLISIPFKRSGWYPEIQTGMASITSEGFIGTPVHDAYIRVAPRPEDFPAFVATMRNGMSRDYDWTTQVVALKTPTLFIAGDADSFPPSHAAEFFGLLGGGQQDAGWTGENRIASQLAILPGTTHYSIFSRADLLLPIITPFLAGQNA